MKKLVIAAMAAAMAFVSTNSFAQGQYGPNSDECIKYLSYYSEYYKQKSYDDATPSWRKAYNLCPPSSRQSLLVDGTVLVRRLISKNANNPVYKKALVDSLLTLHDQRAQYFPKYAVTALNNKALDLSNYIKDDNERLFKEYSAIIEANKSETKAQVFLFDLNAAIELYKVGLGDEETVINVYQNNLALLDAAQPKTETEKEQNAKVRTDIESLFISSKVADCDKLIELFTPRYEANSNDLDLATNIVKMMSLTEGCTDNELYLKAATTMYTLNPSPSSAYFLYKLNAGKGNYDAAEKYMKESLVDADAKTLADRNYELAAFSYKSSKPAKAFEYAKAVLDGTADSALQAKAYFLIGQIWVTTSCGGDEISRRAPYWVAVDYFQKAKAADESLTEEANKFISTCARYYPQTAEAFMYDITDGQSYTVSCGGMRATTTVRTQK